MSLLAGRYRLGETIGQGGSAVVRYGFDTTLKRPVAIKMFHEAATDVLLEARTSAGLSHPNIAQVYDYGEVDGDHGRTPYLVLEYVDGETLADRLARTGALRWRQAAEIAADTASALAAAHAQDLVHRDVNPRNVMLTPDGVKVLDFGIATAAGQNSFDANGGLWGSPAHLAPEQLRGEPAFPAADIYGLGLLLFEALTGSRAWPGESLGAILATRHGRPAPRLPRIAGLPRDVVRIYEACTTEDPGARPSATEVAAAFRRVTGLTSLGRPALPASPIRSGARPSSPIRYGARPAEPAPGPATNARRHARRRATVMASAAVVAAVVSIFGVQLANGTVTPGGREAEAAVEGAVEGAPPATTAPRADRPASPSPTTTRVRETTDTDTTTVSVRRKGSSSSRDDEATPTTAPSARPSTAPPTTRPAAPSKPPATTPPPVQPTPTRTPEDTTPPAEPTAEPTDPETTAPEETPPVTTDPEVEVEGDGATEAPEAGTTAV